MSTLPEIEAAVESLPARDQKALFAFLASRLGHGTGIKRLKTRHGLRAATCPALEGLPADLSVAAKERVRTLVTNRHAANR